MSTLEPLVYDHAGARLTGLLARPSGIARAAIVLYPTIVNANEAMERRARMLADAGFLDPATAFRDAIHLTPAGQAQLAEALAACARAILPAAG